MFFFFFERLNDYILSNRNIFIFLGELVSLDVVENSVKFFSSIGCSVKFFDNILDISIDFLDDFFFDLFFYIDLIRVIVLISLNLRVEMPLLNSRLNKLKNKIKIYSFGIYGYYNKYFIQVIGNSIFDLVKFFNGSSILNKILNFRSFFFCGFSFFLKLFGVFFIFGRSFYLKISSFLFNYLKFSFLVKFKSSFCFNLITTVGLLNYLSIIFKNKFINSDFILNNGFIFLENTGKNNVKVGGNNFIVYRGLFFDDIVNSFNLIIPTLSFFEAESKYLNFVGLLKKTKKVVDFNESILTDNEFFDCLIFFKNLIFKNFFFNFFPIKKFKIFFLFLNIDFLNINYELNFRIDLILINLKLKSNVVNEILHSFIINYYKSDIYSKNSKNLCLASFEYLSMLNTYL